MLPKSLGVSTRPWPKWYCQMRLTITRAVSGLSGSVIHSASASRRCCSGASAGSSSRAPTQPSAPGVDLFLRLHRVAALQAERLAGLGWNVPGTPSPRRAPVLRQLLPDLARSAMQRRQLHRGLRCRSRRERVDGDPTYRPARKAAGRTARATTFHSPPSSATSTVYRVASRSLNLWSRSRPHTTRSIATGSVNSICTHPLPISLRDPAPLVAVPAVVDVLELVDLELGVACRTPSPSPPPTPARRCAARRRSCRPPARQCTARRRSSRAR